MIWPPPTPSLTALEAASRSAGGDNRAYGQAVGLAGERSTIQHAHREAGDNFAKLAALMADQPRPIRKRQ